MSMTLETPGTHRFDPFFRPRREARSGGAKPLDSRLREDEGNGPDLARRRAIGSGALYAAGCGHSRWLHALLLLALTLACVFWPGQARAQSCWASGAVSLSFGTVTGSGGTATSSGLSAICQSGGSATYFRMCFYLGPGGQSSGSVSPRRMINYSTSSYMDYYLYSDAARTQLLGPVGGGYPTYTLDAVAAGSYVQTTTPLTVYGSVPSGQTVAAGAYQEQGQGGTLYYRYSTSGYPTSCTTGGSGGGTVTTSSSGITANYADACAISTATTLDFGSVTSLAGAQDQVSTITLRCPTGTAWKLGLDNGQNASGSTRRMTDGNGRYISYELYRDIARSQRWGNTPGTDSSDGTGSGSAQTATVYGRVPAQAVSAAGTYSDTVTVTLTF